LKKNFTIAVLCAAVFLHPVEAKQSQSVPYQGQNIGRYQMFFSPIVRADTFLLDTRSGAVRQMVKKSNGDSHWETVECIPSPEKSVTNDRYKIYFSPIVRADTFLLDVVTGKTWQMMEDPKNKEKLFGMITSDHAENPDLFNRPLLGSGLSGLDGKK
jgi:hypothetical protein